MRLIAAVCFCCLMLAPLTARQGGDLRVEQLVAAVSEERLGALLRGLTAFHTRHVLSNPDPRGKEIGGAREYILTEFRGSSPRLHVALDSYRIPAQTERIPRDAELHNVIAVLPGRTARRLYVTGHYDSRTTDVLDAAGAAPGANDDGSGTALVMELARVFAQSGHEFDATLVFMAVSGEEAFWAGSRLHAQKAVAENTVIEAVLNNDIVGGATGGTGLANTNVVRVFSDGPEDSPSRQVARHVRRVAAQYVPAHRVELIARHDRFARGGDHSAFNQHGFAAVRFIEAHENYARQHSGADTIDGVSFAYLARNARVNAAALAVLALAPAAPVVRTKAGAPMLTRGQSGYDAVLAWEPSPGAAGYRMYRRAAWDPDWTEVVSLGQVNEYRLSGVSIDDYVFGVSAVSAAGHESLVSVYVNPPRPDIIFRTLP